MRTDGKGVRLEPQAPGGGDAGRRDVRRVFVIFGAAALAHLLLGRWLDAAFFVAFGLVMLLDAPALRLPKAARYTVVAAFGVFAIYRFIKLVAEFSALW